MQAPAVSISVSGSLGFLGLCAYCLTLLPTCTRILLPKVSKMALIKKLAKYRRHLGVTAFILSLLHGGIWLYSSKVNLLQWQVLGQCWHGLSCLGIFSLLAITSNNWSIKAMKRRWKQLHQLTYVALFILTVHIWEKTAHQWSLATPFSRGLILGSVLLVCLRFYRQWHKDKPPATPRST